VRIDLIFQQLESDVLRQAGSIVKVRLSFGQIKIREAEQQQQLCKQRERERDGFLGWIGCWTCT
jgi:hypothetical protein